MKIRPFDVEIWMNRYETQCACNLAETCVDSLTLAELLNLTGRGQDYLSQLMPLRLGYGDIQGSHRLRTAIAALYDRQTADDVLVAHGAIGANALVHAALVEPGDRVVSILPAYQQHHSIPESFRAKVQPLWLREDSGFLPDLDELRRTVQPGTKLIALTNPGNPTGALMDRAMLEELVEIADACGTWILCDEVYRGTDQQGNGTTASIADLYGRGISTGSMSKAFSLAGLRLGWIVAPRPVLEAASIHRDYNTISVGMLDDHLAAIALESAEAILARSRRIVRENLAVLDEWIANEPRISHVKPRSGTTALLKYASALNSEEFCNRLLEETGVLLTPGRAFGMEGYLRIGYANHISILREGLSRFSNFLRHLNV